MVSVVISTTRFTSSASRIVNAEGNRRMSDLQVIAAACLVAFAVNTVVSFYFAYHWLAGTIVASRADRVARRLAATRTVQFGLVAIIFATIGFVIVAVGT